MTRKKCNSCGDELFAAQNITKARLDHHWYKCTKCTTAYKKKRRKDMKFRAVEYKGGHCYDCGVAYPDFVFDFHHVNPEDRAYRGDVIRDIKWEAMKEELDKCVLLCANCHRIRHHKEEEDD